MILPRRIRVLMTLGSSGGCACAEILRLGFLYTNFGSLEMCRNCRLLSFSVPMENLTWRRMELSSYVGESPLDWLLT